MNNPHPIVYRPEDREPSKITDPLVIEIYGKFVGSIYLQCYVHTLSCINGAICLEMPFEVEWGFDLGVQARKTVKQLVVVTAVGSLFDRY